MIGPNQKKKDKKMIKWMLYEKLKKKLQLKKWIQKLNKFLFNNLLKLNLLLHPNINQLILQKTIKKFNNNNNKFDPNLLKNL